MLIIDKKISDKIEKLKIDPNKLLKKEIEKIELENSQLPKDVRESLFKRKNDIIDNFHGKSIKVHYKKLDIDMVIKTEVFNLSDCNYIILNHKFKNIGRNLERFLNNFIINCDLEDEINTFDMVKKTNEYKIFEKEVTAFKKDVEKLQKHYSFDKEDFIY